MTKTQFIDLLVKLVKTISKEGFKDEIFGCDFGYEESGLFLQVWSYDLDTKEITEGYTESKELAKKALAAAKAAYGDACNSINISVCNDDVPMLSFCDNYLMVQCLDVR